MPRIRSIKPEFWTSEQIADCSRDARLLFIGIWNFADDGGVHPYSPKRLRMEIFPGDAIDDAEIASMVDELVNVGLMRKFEADGKTYLHVTGFNRHQQIKKPSLKYPSPPAESTRENATPQSPQQTQEPQRGHGGRQGEPETPYAQQSNQRESQQTSRRESAPQDSMQNSGTSPEPVPHHSGTGTVPVPNQCGTGSTPVGNRFGTSGEPVPHRHPPDRIGSEGNGKETGSDRIGGSKNTCSSSKRPPPEANQPPGSGSDRSDSGVFEKLELSDLKSIESLHRWHGWASKQKRPVIGGTERDFLNVVCAAERALEKGKNPVALFIDLVSNKRWDFITQAQEDAALARIREFRESARKRGNGRQPTRRESQTANSGDDSKKAEPVSLGESIGNILENAQQVHDANSGFG